MPRSLPGFFINATDSYCCEGNPFVSVVNSDLPLIERGRERREEWIDAARRIKNHVDNVCYMILNDDNLSFYMNGGYAEYPATACENMKMIGNAIIYTIEQLDTTKIYKSYTDVANIISARHPDFIPIAQEAIIAFGAAENIVKELIKARDTESLFSLVCRAYNPLQKEHNFLTEHTKKQVYYLEYNENNLFDFLAAPQLILCQSDAEYPERFMSF